MTRDAARAAIIAAFTAKGIDVLYGKGGFWLRGQGWVSFADARRLSGVKAAPANRQPRVSAYGDWAWVAAINGVRR